MHLVRHPLIARCSHVLSPYLGHHALVIAKTYLLTRQLTVQMKRPHHPLILHNPLEAIRHIGRQKLIRSPVRIVINLRKPLDKSLLFRHCVALLHDYL